MMRSDCSAWLSSCHSAACATSSRTSSTVPSNLVPFGIVAPLSDFACASCSAVTCATEQAGDIQVAWSASDGWSGLDTCAVEVWDDITNWETPSTTCSGETLYDAESGRHYTFRFRATDEAGNLTRVFGGPSVGTETTYYSHAGRRVAMRTGGEVYYLYGDHQSD